MHAPHTANEDRNTLFIRVAHKDACFAYCTRNELCMAKYKRLKDVKKNESREKKDQEMHKYTHEYDMCAQRSKNTILTPFFVLAFSGHFFEIFVQSAMH